MNAKSPTLQAVRFAEPLYAAGMLAWFAGFAAASGNGGFRPLELAAQLGPVFPAAAVAGTVLVWLVAVLAVWKLLSLFLAGPLPKLCQPASPLAILANVLLSLAALAVQIMHALSFGTGVEYFRSYTPALWAITGITFVWNAVSIYALIRSISSRDAAWSEYQEFKDKNVEDKGGPLARVSSWGIQRRLVVSFITIIFLVIAVLGYILLRDFSSTILVAVRQNGVNLTEQTAGVIKSAAGDSIAIEDFMIAQQKKNAEASFPFTNLTFWRYDPKAGQMTALYSTDTQLVNTVSQADKDIQLTASIFRDVDDGKGIMFLSPVILGGKTIGLVNAVYEKAIILRPYYQTEFKVYIIAGIFLYLSIFTTYLFGRNIVIPILFLRMSVNAISTMLSEMVRGERLINTGDLHYRDRVTSRDEIKSLSLEIGNMATVIRGVIPYISASTLKASERDTPSSEKRELCFLFTDIRGFTTLCEGREPDEVVDMLNHFLELQTSIILANKGDVDKFVGDEIMAMFEGPDKELNACRAALQIRMRMAEEREKALAANEHVVSIGIGVNTGPVIFGSVGAQKRMDFTSIGDTVNLAARLEGANKTYGTKTLITEAVWRHIKNEFVCREIDYLTVKGKSQPVRVYEVLHELEGCSDRVKELAATFDEGLQAYRVQDWVKAEQTFLHLIKEFDDETSEIFLNRVSMFRKSPPSPDWDGVFNLTVK